jgi:hypothetical protein
LGLAFEQEVTRRGHEHWQIVNILAGPELVRVKTQPQKYRSFLASSRVAI